MVKRLITAVCLLTVVLGAIFGLRIFNLVFADMVAVLFGSVGVYELYNALKKARLNPMALPLVISAVIAYPCVYFLGVGGIMIALSVAVMTALAVFMFKSGYTLSDLMTTVFIAVYPLAMFYLFVPINHEYGNLLGILLVLAVPILTDTMAYFTGSLLKGPKLCPNISPKKTISGAIGGLIGGMMGGVIVFMLFDYGNVFASFGNVGRTALIAGNLYGSLGVYLAVGLVGGLLSEIGDLAASWIKRKAEIKDFGKIFPGHGGFMDRIDSILFMLPLVYALFAILGACGA